MSIDKTTNMQLKTDVPLYGSNIDDVTDDVNHPLMVTNVINICI
jgi:hypothetical protein